VTHEATSQARSSEGGVRREPEVFRGFDFGVENPCRCWGVRWDREHGPAGPEVARAPGAGLVHVMQPHQDGIWGFFCLR
jgi:hypothetical protein